MEVRHEAQEMLVRGLAKSGCAATLRRGLASSTFPPAWQKLATKELKGADPAERLTWHTPEGVALKPMYTAADVADTRNFDGADAEAHVPGVFPFKLLKGDLHPRLKMYYDTVF